MSNKIRVLTNISASQNVIVSGSTVISGSKLLATTSSFDNSSVVTSSDGLYNVDEAIHGLDNGITTLKNNIKTAYDSVRAVITGTLGLSGNEKINLTTTIPSGSLYFTTSSLTSVGASVLVVTEEDEIYRNDLISLQLFNSASYLWAEIDAPTSINDPYRLIVVYHGSLPLGNSSSSGGDAGGGGGSSGGSGENLFIIYAPITTPTGSVNDSVDDGHEGYYVYPDVSGNVTIVINDFSASTNDGGIGFYVVPNNYTGSITYDENTDIINSNDLERIVTLAGDVTNTQIDTPSGNTLDETVPGEEYNVYMEPNLTSSIINDGTTVTLTIPVGTGSTVYVDTYSNTTPTTYDLDWSGGVYNNSGSEAATYVPTFVTGGYWVGGGATFGENTPVVTVTGSEKIVLNFNQGYKGKILIQPPTGNLNGTLLDDVYVKWSGGGDVTVLLSQNYYDTLVNGSLMIRRPGETGFYFQADGQFDLTTLNYDAENDSYWRYTNYRMHGTIFMSSTEREGYPANYNFAQDPILYHTRQAPWGWVSPGEYVRDGAMILVHGEGTSVEIWFTYI